MQLSVVHELALVNMHWQEQLLEGLMKDSWACAQIVTGQSLQLRRGMDLVQVVDFSLGGH